MLDTKGLESYLSLQICLRAMAITLIDTEEKSHSFLIIGSSFNNSSVTAER
jgi:hypothetical protein